MTTTDNDFGGEIVVAPSILSADFSTLATELASVESAVKWLHIDVMDAHFVPNLTLGPPVVKSIRKHSKAYFDVHLMMTNPEEYFGPFAAVGADSVTIHVEIGDTANRIKAAREHGLKIGLALNPDTSYSAVRPYLADIDLLLVMSVFPGFGGQSFIPEVLAKVGKARQDIDKEGLAVALEIDGGINPETAALASASGARVFVAGSAIFSASDRVAAIREIHSSASQNMHR